MSDGEGGSVPVLGVLLAAGSSRRFGDRAKLAEEIGGRSLLERACAALAGSRAHRAVAILGADEATLRPLCETAGLTVVVNPRHAEGQGTSVALGARSLADDEVGLVYVAADQPLLGAADIDAVVAAGLAQDVVARAVGDDGAGGRVKGTPVYWPRRFAGQLGALEGDEGARRILRRLAPGELVDVTIAAAALRDVDTLRDLDRLRGEA